MLRLIKKDHKLYIGHWWKISLWGTWTQLLRHQNTTQINLKNWKNKMIMLGTISTKNLSNHWNNTFKRILLLDWHGITMVLTITPTFMNLYKKRLKSQELSKIRKCRLKKLDLLHRMKGKNQKLYNLSYNRHLWYQLKTRAWCQVPLLLCYQVYY